ncbi:purine/pyrimidine permease [Pusillimonas sp. MFBS29]|uniref:uracil-xanthine permease family protein n=1 Tax=Pusillimonas sp. MFBS29 TaxID=2886690 RepID=UPI001D11C48C|nr:solute carrier family 23 protein [Pusillimonas sp. MFBS29]MCC2597574.1 purine/pyrimidine permease [Pusillimonas sp. MFBS29]
MSIFSRFKLPPSPAVKRPADLLYSADEKVPGVALGGLALQHMATALALIAYVLASAKIGGLDPDTTRSMVTATIIGMAIATFLQSWGKPFGARALIVHMPDPLLVVIVGLATAEYGLGALVLIGLVNGSVAMGAGYIIPRLRSVFPPAVAGIVICVAGLSLIEPAVLHTTNMGSNNTINLTDTAVGLITLAIIVVMSIWGSQRVKLLALLSGLIVGIILTALLGEIEGTEQLAHTPIFGLPSLHMPAFEIDLGVLFAVGLLSLMTQLDTFGSAVLLQKMNDHDWRRADMNLAGSGIRANGLGNVIASWLGAFPNAVSSANIALAHISRSTSRWIGVMTAALLLLASFLPQVSLALTLIPTSVIGAVELYAAAYLIVSGIELIASRAMDSRGIFLVGLSFIAGVGTMFVPALAELAPVSIQFVLKNGIIVAGLTAIILNLLFRLGTSRRVRMQIDPASDPATLARQAVDFVEQHGAGWSARREVIRRAAMAALEATEALQADSSRRLLSIQGSFDEFNFDLELSHSGAPLQLGAQATPAHDSLLDFDGPDFDAALDRAMATLPGVLLKRMADRISTGSNGKNAYLRLHFDH